MKKRNIDTDVYARYTAEDWEGFRQLVSARPAGQGVDPACTGDVSRFGDAREREIKNISYVFEEPATTILPQLRRSRIIANIEIVGKSDEEIMTAWKNNPKELVGGRATLCFLADR